MKYKTRFGTYTVKFIPKYYSNGRLAILMIDEKDDLPVAMPTFNCPDVELNPGEVVIKDYAENSGILDFLTANGLVTDTGRTPEGYRSKTHIVKVTGKLNGILKEAGLSDPWITSGKIHAKVATG